MPLAKILPVASDLATPPAQIVVGTAAIPLLYDNSQRKRLIVQNTGTTVIKLVLGKVAPTATVYHVALKACTGADDGSGGAFIDEMWQGDVWALSSAASGTVVVTELL